jgi:hypothetical protein
VKETLIIPNMKLIHEYKRKRNVHSHPVGSSISHEIHEKKYLNKVFFLFWFSWNTKKKKHQLDRQGFFFLFFLCGRDV